MNPDIHDKFKPIVQVLLGLFPWVNTESNDFMIRSDGFMAIRLWPHCTCAIQITGTGNKGAVNIISPKTPDHPSCFGLGDLAEAVGIVSTLLPEWLETKAFNKPVFFVSPHPGGIHLIPRGPRAYFILGSPSMNAFKAVGNSEWLPESRCYDYLRKHEKTDFHQISDVIDILDPKLSGRFPSSVADALAIEKLKKLS
jgi:hypothetical protein